MRTTASGFACRSLRQRSLPLQLRSLGIWRDVHQCSDQPQQSLLLRPRPLSQERPELDVGETPSGRRVGLVNNESVPVLRLPAKEPGVAIRAAVELSAIRHMGSHACCFGVARDGRRSRRRVKPLKLRVEAPPSRSAGHATFIEAALEARSPRSRRGRQSKEDKYRSVEPNNVRGVQRPDPATHFRLGDGGDLVHHQATCGAKTVSRIRLDRKPEQRRLRRIAREWAHHKQIQALKTVVLDDDDRPRFSGVVACAGNGPYFASPHP